VTLTAQPDGGRIQNRAKDDLIIRVADVPDVHAATICGTRLTGPPRTVIDLARILPFMDGVVVADSAIRKRKTTKPQMRKVLESCKQWPGTARAQRVIDFSTGLAESVLESCARVVFEEAGLPSPELQIEFIDHATLGSARVDFYWREYKTAAEADGMKKYEDDPGAMRRQFKRDRLLRDLGHKLVHFTWYELFNQQALVIARIQEAFAASSPW